jgi:rod shape-determining protein MreD
VVIHLGLAALVYIAAAAQAVLAPRLAVAGAGPEFLLLAAVAAVLSIRGWPALVWVAAIGLIGDCLSDRPPGAGMLAATVVLLFVQRGLHAQPRISPIRIALICTIGIALIVLIHEAILSVVAGLALDAPGLLLESVSTAAYSAFLALAIQLIWHLLIARFSLRQPTHPG